MFLTVVLQGFVTHFFRLMMVQNVWLNQNAPCCRFLCLFVDIVYIRGLSGFQSVDPAGYSMFPMAVFCPFSGFQEAPVLVWMACFTKHSKHLKVLFWFCLG